MHEVLQGTVRLVVGASVYLGKGVEWPEYNRLYWRVYAEEGRRILRPDGFLVVIQTDAYVAGAVLPRNVLLPQTMFAAGFRLIDVKVWSRRAADFFQVPYSQVFVFAPPGSTHTRDGCNKRSTEYFQGVWNYPQGKGGELNSYPLQLCRLLVEAFTEPGDLIVDPFAGTARLLGIAATMGRSAVGYEVNLDLWQVVTGNLEPPAGLGL